MNNSIAETLHCVNPSSPITTKMSVLERQRQRQPLKWQQEQLIQQQPISNLNGNEQLGAFLFGNNDQGFVELLSGRTMKPDLGMETGWGDDDLGKLLNYGNGSDFEATYAIPRTASCPPSVAASMAEVAASKGLALSPATGKENPKKRKADKSPNIKAGEGKDQEKKMKECAEEEGSKISQEYSNSNSKSTTTTNGSKKTDKSNVSDFPKQDYIHVRARRGQATDSHSLAERVRREKISERMKYLQDLVPGCNKITGKAGMLDEIINYVQSLQKQVEFLSMKLAAVNPRQDCEADNYFVKEQMFPACTSGVVNAAQVHFNALAQDIGVIPQDATLRRAISAPVHIPDAVLESACFNQVQHLNWDAEIQNLLSMEYQQGRPPSFVSQPFAGYMETGHVKMEM